MSGAETAARRSSGPLGEPAFRLFYIGVLLTMLGAWMSNVACAWLMHKLAPSGIMLGVLQAGFMVPVVVLSLPAGVLADTLNRRSSAIIGGLSMSAICTSLTSFCLLGHASVTVLLAHALAMGVVTALIGPLVMAIVQDMVSAEHLPRAVTLYSIALNGGRAVGPAAAGFLIAKAGVAAAFAANAAAYAVFAVTLWLWRAPKQVRAVERGMAQALLGGLRHAARDETFRTLLIRLLVFLISASGLLTITPLVAHARIDASPQAFGDMTAGIGLGALAGAFGRGFIAERWPDLVRVEACSILVALAYFGLAACHGLPAALACVAVFGIGWTNAAISFQSLAQLSLPPELRGRGIAIYLTIFALGTLLGGLAAGFVVDRLGVGSSLALAGACALLLDRAALFLGRARRPRSDSLQGH